MVIQMCSIVRVRGNKEESYPRLSIRYRFMFSLLDQMPFLPGDSSPQVSMPHEQTALERKIEATDRQIDALVYELYGLTEEEIAIVEGGRAED